MTDDWHSLTLTEHELAVALLSQPFSGRDALMAQLEDAQARTIDTDGSFALRVTAPPAKVLFRVPVTGSTRDPDGVGVEVLLHVLDGFMSEVEIYRVDGEAVRAQVDPSTLELITLPVVGDIPRR